MRFEPEQRVEGREFMDAEVARFGSLCPVSGYKEANDSTLALTVRNAKQEINKGDVNKIYLLSGKPIGSDTGKGAAIGATAGGNLGEAPLGDQLLARVFVAILFAIPGAIIGLIAGASHHSRQLIYER